MYHLLSKEGYDQNVFIKATAKIDRKKFEDIGEGNLEDLQNKLEFIRATMRDFEEIGTNPSLLKAWNNYLTVKRLVE